MSAGVHADVSFRDVTIKIPDRGYDQGCEWRHAPEAWAEIWEKKWVSWVLPSEEEGWLSRARRGLASGAHVVWGRWKSQHIKMVSLSICRKPFKLKGNKRFRTWTKKSSSVFRVSGFLCYLYVRYGHYERFAYRYEYVHFTYSYLAI